MERRELLKMIALVTGGAVIGGEFFLTGCTTGANSDAGFTAKHINLLDEIAETIIPATSTPGAKAAKVGEFMKVMVTDCYTKPQQEIFMKGISQIDELSDKMYGYSFVKASPAQRHELLVTLEKEAKAFTDKIKEEDNIRRTAIENKNNTIPWKDQVQFEPTPSHYYYMMKQLTLLGFFTSETGMKDTLRYNPVPGRYDGNLPYQKGDKAWAE